MHLAQKLRFFSSLAIIAEKGCNIDPHGTINLLWEKLCQNKLQSQAGIRNLFGSCVEQKKEEEARIIKSPSLGPMWTRNKLQLSFFGTKISQILKPEA